MAFVPTTLDRIVKPSSTVRFFELVPYPERYENEVCGRDFVTLTGALLDKRMKMSIIKRGMLIPQSLVTDLRIR